MGRLPMVKTTSLLALAGFAATATNAFFLKSDLNSESNAPAVAGMDHLNLKWSDCSQGKGIAKLLDITPNTLAIGGDETTVSGKFDLKEEVSGAKFSFIMKGVGTTLINCQGNYKGAQFPLAAGVHEGTPSVSFKIPMVPKFA